MVIMVIMTMEYVEELVIDINYLMIIFHDKYDVHIMIIDGWYVTMISIIVILYNGYVE